MMFPRARTRAGIGLMLLLAVTALFLTPREGAHSAPPDSAPNRRGDQPGAPIKATLDQLSWISGAWAGPGLGGHAEEHWTSPRGDSMVGMFRLTGDDDKHRVSEFIMIEQAGEHIVYRFRHFGSGHAPWEDADKPLTFDLIKLTENRAVFHSAVQASPRRLTYTRTDDKLIIRVQGDNEDGTLGRGFIVALTRTRLGDTE